MFSSEKAAYIAELRKTVRLLLDEIRDMKERLALLRKRSTGSSPEQRQKSTLRSNDRCAGGRPYMENDRAVIYNIVETAKGNDFAPRDYIQFLFEKLPDMDISTHPKRLSQMLP